MGNYAFIIKTSNRQKIKFFSISMIFLAMLIFLSSIFYSTVYNFIEDFFRGQSLFEFLKRKIGDFTPSGLFYASFIGGSIFFPMPVDLFYYIGLTRGNSIILSMIAVIIGFFLIQLTNYWLGLKLGGFFLNIISKRKVYKARRMVNKYGAIAVLITNMTPAPAELLTFALGITKYNIYRLFFFTILGTVIKYVAISAFYFVIYQL